MRIRYKFREAAATLVSTFLTRETILPEILDRAVRTLSEENWFKANMTICAVTKYDMREDMLKYADTNLTRLQAGNLKEHLNTNLSKLGLVAWRYQMDVLDRYLNEEFTIKLPSQKKITDLKWFSVYDLTSQVICP